MKFVHDQQPVQARQAQQATLSDEDPTNAPDVAYALRIRLIVCSAALRIRHNLLLFVTLTNRFTPIPFMQSTTSSRSVFSNGSLMAQPVSNTEEWDLRGYPPHMHSTISTILHEQAHIRWFKGIEGFLSSQPLNSIGKHVYGFANLYQCSHGA
jgi:hypothetical protein